MTGMIFVDGTNLFYRLSGEKLKLPAVTRLFQHPTIMRPVLRIYLYTTKQKYAEAQKIHGENFCGGVRVVYGEGIPTKDGNIKEKGVDALLVADLVYHAASKNCDYAVVVTCDTDFVHALRRVEDFGCRTAVVGVCHEAPEQLRLGCDDYINLDVDFLLSQGIVSRIPSSTS